MVGMLIFVILGVALVVGALLVKGTPHKFDDHDPHDWP